MLAIYFLLTRLPRPLRILVAIMLAGFVIQCLAHVLGFDPTQEKQQHVHTRRSTR